MEGLVGLLRPSKHGTVGDSNAVDNLSSVLGLDLILGANGHQVRGLGVINGVQIGLLPDAAIDGRLLGNNLAEGVLPVAATAARFITRSSSSVGVDLFAEQVGRDVLVRGVASDLVLLLEGLKICLGEYEGIPDVLLGADEIVLARQALLRRDAALEQKPRPILLGVRELLVGLGPHAQPANFDRGVVVDLVPGGPDVGGHAGHEKMLLWGGNAVDVDGGVEFKIMVLEWIVDNGHGGCTVRGLRVWLDDCWVRHDGGGGWRSGGGLERVCRASRWWEWFDRMEWAT